MNDKLDNIVYMDQIRHISQSLARPPLKGGGGGGTFDGMEARVAKLEATASHIERDVADLRTDVRSIKDSAADLRERLARVEENVRHLPSKGFIVTCTLLTFSFLGGIALFAPKLQALIGIAPKP